MDASLKVSERPARRGAAWIGEAFAMFRAQPLAWMSLCVTWALIWMLLMLLPVVGLVAAYLLQPVFFGSFAIAAYKQSAGERITASALFSGFRRSARALVNVGFVMLFVQVLAIWMMRVMGLPSWPEERDFDLYAYAEMLRDSRWILLAGMIVSTAASGALWFAPQLIVFHGMPASHAIRWSLYAALANLGAMVVYGVLMVTFMMLAWLPFGLGLLVLLPIMVISTFTSYRDVFGVVMEPSPTR
jgi:hypothetical protein